jgi:hypothetical protein
MFIGMIALAMLVTVPLAGGSLRRLADIRIRGLALLVPTLLVQVVITDVVTKPAALLAAIHVCTYVAAGVVIWLNRRVPGILLIATGAALNAVTIAVNGGTLPATASALRAAGIHEDAGNFANSGVLAHPKLAFLGDTMSTPSFLPFRNVISIGDLVVLAGLFVLLHVTCRSKIGDLIRRGAARPGELVREVVGEPTTGAASARMLTSTALQAAAWPGGWVSGTAVRPVSPPGRAA